MRVERVLKLYVECLLYNVKFHFLCQKVISLRKNLYEPRRLVKLE